MILQLITPAEDWPVSLDDLKEHLTIETDDEDMRLEAYLDAATAYVEAETARALVEQEWTLTISHFPLWPTPHNPYRIYLPKPPCLSVDSITYYDANNNVQTLDPDEYYVLTPTNGQAWIEPVAAWPATYSRPDAVTVSFRAGYETVPPQAIHAIKMIVANWNENREALIVGTISGATEFAVKALLQQLNTGIYQ